MQQYQPQVDDNEQPIQAEAVPRRSMAEHCSNICSEIGGELLTLYFYIAINIYLLTLHYETDFTIKEKKWIVQTIFLLSTGLFIAIVARLLLML